MIEMINEVISAKAALNEMYPNNPAPGKLYFSKNSKI